MKAATKPSFLPFVFLLQHKKSLAIVSEVVSLQLFSGLKGHSPYPPFQKSFVMGSERDHKQQARLVSRHCFVLGSHARTGFYSLALHLLLVKMSQCTSSGMEGAVSSLGMHNSFVALSVLATLGSQVPSG